VEAGVCGPLKRAGDNNDVPVNGPGSRAPGDGGEEEEEWREETHKEGALVLADKDAIEE